MTWKLYQKGFWTESQYVENTYQQLNEIDKEYHKQALRSVVAHLKSAHPEWDYAMNYFKTLYRSMYDRII